MKKLAAIAMIAIFSMLFLGFPGQSMAGVSIGINIPVPPLFTFPAPPELVVIPGTYAYYCPDAGVNVFFYAGYWYRPYEGYWYRSASYNGRWAYTSHAPSVIVNLPPDYRVRAEGARHIPYAELHRNWRGWERDRYWEHHNWGRPENERHYGAAPAYGEGEHGGYHQEGGHGDHGRH
jgi:hypothetical protein